MNCKPAIAVVYASATGNTEGLALMLAEAFGEYGETTVCDNADAAAIGNADILAVGTYTWGSGDLPPAAEELYDTVERLAEKYQVTVAFGTGDRFYPHFCGAVDHFRDMLFARTTLAAVLKVELAPQPGDRERCRKAAASAFAKYKKNAGEAAVAAAVPRRS